MITQLGRYTIDSLIGQGGQARVYRVKHPFIPGKFLALKCHQNQNTFEQERDHLLALDPLHLTQVPSLIDAFSLPEGHCLVMTLFADLTSPALPMNWRQTLSLMQELGGVVRQLHQAGVLYLDLKPENVLFSRSGGVHLIDYGNSQRTSHAISTGIGTPGFAAPEQLRAGQQVGAFTDTYALGALGRYWLTGEVHVPGQEVHFREPLPSGFKSVLLGMLHPQAQQRHTLDLLLNLQESQLAQEMVRCQRCHRENPRNAERCHHCSQILTDTPSAPKINVPMILPPMHIPAPAGNTALVLQELSKPARTRDLDLRSLRLQAEAISKLPSFETLLAPERLKHRLELYPHQLHAVERALREMRGQVMLADEVGLGKTIEAGVILKELHIRKLVKKVVIVVPAHLVDQWVSEMQEKLELPFEAYSRETAHKDLLVMSFFQKPNFSKLNVDALIIDEMHNLLRKDGQPRKVYENLAGVPRKYTMLLSATPIRKDVRELYHLINFIQPNFFLSFNDFFSRVRNKKDLKVVLQELMIHNRRHEIKSSYQNVLPPDRQMHTLSVRMDPQEENLQNQLLHLIRTGRIPARELSKAFSSLGSRLELARTYGVPHQATTSKKLEALDGLLKSIGKQVVVFTREASTVHFLARELRHKGHHVIEFAPGLSRKEKAERFYHFRRTPKGILVSTDAAAEGRNLQFSHHLVHFDLPWNPLQMEQRMGRIDRLGQKEIPHIYTLLYEEDFEELIYNSVFKNGLGMFDLIIGELASVLQDFEFQGEKDRTIDQILTNLWKTSPDVRSLNRNLGLLSAELRKARQEFDQDRKTQKHFDIGEELF
ncbi:protein kinase domain-containing protein [Deinococcus cellulosilyticus]|uniref:Uncharacterized protein n=1 Tax=Deinococcus cellulosilyticus (strain DSM 18568 / NBRC 106333 / KACC 11606 / 5516J-15) TaxID=1223518 RepID=A0A511N390_DEIC1|nr:SNF2-related protein [Deinococcus cellulosilyticus]GEM46967.1 hypothetical protein DC3_26020 [Deinococcus cellulosilyticus NBRC 106333 = KACC 11606]